MPDNYRERLNKIMSPCRRMGDKLIDTVRLVEDLIAEVERLERVNRAMQEEGKYLREGDI